MLTRKFIMRLTILLFFALLRTSPPAFCNEIPLLPEANKSVSPLTDMDIKDKTKPLDALLYPGNYFDQKVATVLLKDQSLKTSIWKVIPAWQAGEWEQTQAINTKSVKYVNGEPSSIAPRGVYGAQSKATLGCQKDRNGDIWHLFGSGYWVEADLDTYIMHSFVKASAPGTGDYPDFYAESISISVDKLSGKILHVCQSKTFDLHVFLADGLMKDEQVRTVYDETGQLQFKAWNTILLKRIKTFSENEELLVSQPKVNQELHQIFVKYLKENGLANLTADCKQPLSMTRPLLVEHSNSPSAKAKAAAPLVPSIAGVWSGVAQGSQFSTEAVVELQQNNESVEGSVLTKDLGGDTRRYVRGFYEPKLGVFICKDIGFNYVRNNPGWTHPLIDRYELGLVDQGKHLAGNYTMTAYKENGYFMLERKAKPLGDATSIQSKPHAALTNKLSPSDIALRAFKSTVVVLADRQDYVGQGSGFVIDKSLIVTNYHVIKDATLISVKLVGQPSSYPIKKISFLDKMNDLAVLFCPTLNAPALPLGNSTHTPIGEQVYAIGTPKGLEGTFSNGLLSGVRNEDGKRLLQTTAPLSHGSSGGPLLDGDGTVIGVTSSISDEGQNLNFAVPVEYIKHLFIQ